MSLWGNIFAALYDRMSASTERAGVGAHRTALLAGATGDVLEIGGGTGVNLPYYGPDARAVTIVEPAPPMARRLQRRIDASRPEARLVSASAEALPFDDASFDTVVSTFVLCTVASQPRALAEIRRVLRPGGRLLFIEHVRSDDPKLARRQDRIQPINGFVGHGCHCNRATLDAIRAAGFDVTRVVHDTLKHTMPYLRPMIVGAARPATAASQ